MTDLEKTTLLRAMLEDDTEQDSILLAYLRLAGERILEKAYPFRDDVAAVPAKYDLTQIEIAAYLLNKRGAEGETYHGENRVYRSYPNASVPDEMLAGVIPFCGGLG